MVSHSDAALNRVLRKLSRVESELGRITLSKGSNTTPRVAHVVFDKRYEVTVPKMEIEVPFAGAWMDSIETPSGTLTASHRIELYFSASGIGLLSLADTLALSSDTDAIVLIETAHPDDPDLTSQRVFRVLRPHTVAMSKFIDITQDLTPLLVETLGVSRPAYRDLIEQAFAGNPTTFFDLRDLTQRALIYLIDTLKPHVDSFAKTLNEGTMPPELWDPDATTREYRAALNAAGGKLDTAATDVLDAVAGLPRLAIAKEIRGWIGADSLAGVIDLIAWAEGAWNATLDTVTEIAQIIQKNIPSGQDVIETVIGYLCGLWDGIIQAAGGVIDTVSLGMTLAKTAMQAERNPAAATQVITEAFDEMVQILSRVNWAKLWQTLRDEIFDPLIDLFKTAVDALPDTIARSPGTVGYYTGFLVYNIAEMFFPPLKGVGLARAGKAAAEAVKLSKKLVPA